LLIVKSVVFETRKTVRPRICAYKREKKIDRLFRASSALLSELPGEIAFSP
jgi:hypothetical protein